MIEIRSRKGEKFLAFKKRVKAEAKRRRKTAEREHLAAEVKAFASFASDVSDADAVVCVDVDGNISLSTEKAAERVLDEVAERLDGDLSSSTWQEVGPVETKEDIERKIASEAKEKADREAEEAAGHKLLGIYNEGREAYWMKKKCIDNPYPMHERHGLAWLFGYELSECRDTVRILHMDKRIDTTWYKQELARLEAEVNRPREYKVNMVMKAPKTAFAQAK